MVKLLLDAFKKSKLSGNLASDVELYHVDAKLSSSLEAIGKFQWAKLFSLVKYCAQAYVYRFVHHASVLYYVPAPGLRLAMYRDWIVLCLCRPIFDKVILHWHAAGIANWLEQTATPWERKITERLLGDVDLSIVLSNFGRGDAMRFSPRKIVVVGNGIPDPCPDFEESILPDRQKRLGERVDGRQTNCFTVLFISACTSAKGLFATLEATALINRRLKARKATTFVRLVVAGDFISPRERRQFQDRIARPDLNGPGNVNKGQTLVTYKGFVEGEVKNELFRRSDCLCFPTLYAAESQGVTIIEALAFGLSIIATRWRGIPELLTGSGGYLVDEQNPSAIADGLEKLLLADTMAANRAVFLARYSVEKFLDQMKAAFTGI